MLKPLPSMTEEEVRQCPAPPEAGFGSLTSERGPLPLTAMDVAVRIDGLVAQLALRQTFVNVHDVPLEATYIFPLPDRAAVTRFRLEVAGRVIEGQLKERGAAQREYQQAIEQGHRAAITEEERPGVFTLRVGNLPPGESARVQLTLAGPLPYSNGETTFRFPLVVAPRYIPGTPLPGPSVGDGIATDTDAVPDASRISPPVLLAGYPNPVRLGLRVDFGSSFQPCDLRSSLHTVVEEATFPIRRVTLQPGERLNRDFILRFRLADDRVRTGLSLQPDAEGNEGTFLLTLVPGETPPSCGGATPTTTRPRDVVFVLDRSGSMEGWKIVAARRALARMVDTLTELDRFTVIAFDSAFELPAEFAGQLVSGSDRHRFQAVEFLARIQTQGGTEMAEPLSRALDLLGQDPTPGRDRIAVLVTDGQIGNEDQILQYLGAKAENIRIFTLGIDRAVNAGFLRRLSDLGGGSSELVESEERLEEVMAHVHRMIGTPLLTSLKLEPAGLKVIPGSLVPARLPDLFAGVPLLIMGRYQGLPQGGLSLQGRDPAGKTWQDQIQPSGESSPAVAAVWARGRLRELEDRYAIDNAGRPSLEKEIVSVSLRHGVLCRFTSFVAVDRSEVVNAGGVVQGVVQPVEQPEGWGAVAPTLLACLAAAPALRGAASQNQARAILSRGKPAAASGAPAQDRAKKREEVKEQQTAKQERRRLDADAVNRQDVERASEEQSEFELALDADVSLTPVERTGDLSDENRTLFEETDFDAPSLDDESAPEAAPLDEAADFDLALDDSVELGDHKTADKITLQEDDSDEFTDPRQQAQDLLQACRGCPTTDPAHRLALLQQWQQRLEHLHQGFTDGGEQSPLVERFGQLVVSLKRLLSQPQPPEAEVQALWAELEAALDEYLNGPGISERREGFWK